jgi:small nuclear ribonucleoprotein (snRNP)-like protein
MIFRYRNFFGYRLLHAVQLLLLVLATMPQTASAAKNDIITLANGDRITGEVKSLDRGQVEFSTDAAGTIYIEWNKIEFISVDQDIQVETESGTRYFGRISASDSAFKVLVNTSDGPAELDSTKVVSMNPIDEGGFRNIDLNISAGYNFTKASNVTQFNIALDSKYRTRKRILSADFSSLISDSSNNDISQRQSLSFNYTRLRTNRWLNDGGVSFDRNDELGLNLRTSLSAGGGRILRRTSNSEVTLKGGLKATKENNVDQPSDVNSLESYGIMTWEWYRYDSPELDWSTSLEIIPSLTESGRVRSEFDATLRWEILHDFFWQLSFYNSYDNKPQSEAASKSDYGINTALSYKF